MNELKIENQWIWCSKKSLSRYLWKRLWKGMSDGTCARPREIAVSAASVANATAPLPCSLGSVVASGGGCWRGFFGFALEGR